MEDRLELIVAERKKTSGLTIAVVVSFLLHGGLLWWFAHAYHPLPPNAQNVPIARYVELVKQNPQTFTEAPGPKLEKAPSLNAPLSDANRKASTPEPTGMMPTKRPGVGGGLFVPPRGEEGARAAALPPVSPRQRPAQAQSAANAAQFPPATTQNPAAPSEAFQYRESRSPATSKAAAMSGIDWNSAIRDAAGQAAKLGRADGLGAGLGGEKGSAEQGPLSFETQWFDWGEYAQSMVSRIRVNWDANMPPLFRTGMPGAVVIRFTIHRDGHITDVTILSSSERQPYDLAAKKAIELSSPLKPLPEKFPNPSERVTATFYYNMNVRD